WPVGASTSKTAVNPEPRVSLEVPCNPTSSEMVTCSPKRKGAAGLKVKVSFDAVLLKVREPVSLPWIETCPATVFGSNGWLKRNTKLLSVPICGEFSCGSQEITERCGLTSKVTVATLEVL